MTGRLAIYGAGGMGRELLRAAREWPGEIRFVSDDGPDEVDGVPVVAPEALAPDDRLCIAVGSPALRRRLADRCAAAPLATVIAPTALIDPTASLGPGAMICDFSMINSRARVGAHFLCNYFSHVSHDCVIGDFVTFSPRVSCCGTVEIGDDVFVGAGAVIRNGVLGRPLRIGAGAEIAMGAVVVGDVAAGTRVAGVPARPV